MTDYFLTPARPSHLNDLYRLCRKAFQEGPERDLQIVPEKMRGTIDTMIRNDHQLAVTALVGSRPKGLILGHVDEHAYCRGLVASDLCLYVAPAYRGTDMADRLVEVYTSWCSRIPGLVGSTLSLSRLGPTTPYMEHLFRQYGYVRSGVTYTKLKEL